MTGKKLLLIIIALFIAGWLLPISFSNASEGHGYDLAEWAHDEFIKSLYYFINYFVETDVETNANGMLHAIWIMFVYSSNYLFVICCILYYKNPKWAIYLAPACAISMLIWIGLGIDNIAYYVWLLSGLSLMIFSITEYMKASQLKVIELAKSKVAWSLYAPMLIVGGIFVIGEIINLSA